MIGATISHYRVLEKLGEGGMGVVYKAEDTKLERLVALKFLPQHLLGDQEVRKRFEREAKAAAAVLHPNVIAIHGVSSGDEREMLPYLVMPYVRGSSLQARLDKQGPLSLAEDYMVWNVTKDEIKVRQTLVDHHSWNPPAAYPAEPVKAEDRVGYSPEIEAGRLDVDDVIKPIYEEASKALGKEFEYPEN